MAPEKYYHLVPEVDWRSCVEHGKAYFPATYEADGFTHLSDNREVLLTIGNHFCKQIAGAFLVLVIEPSNLTSEVKLEPAAPVGKIEAHETTPDQLYPHCYGPLDLASVEKELRVQRAEDGTFVSLTE